MWHAVTVFSGSRGHFWDRLILNECMVKMESLINVSTSTNVTIPVCRGNFTAKQMFTGKCTKWQNLYKIKLSCISQSLPWTQLPWTITLIKRQISVSQSNAVNYMYMANWEKKKQLKWDFVVDAFLLWDDKHVLSPCLHLYRWCNFTYCSL